MELKAEAMQAVHSLPHQTTSFIGREQEIAEITRLLDDPACQLLTLIGPGGIGKTRLALEVARLLGTAYGSGVFFIALQPLRSADYIPATIIRELGLPVRVDDDPQQQLLRHLTDRRLLLILDNFEHLLEGVTLIAHMLAAAPHVRLLITSREALNLHEEWLWPVHGLHVPPHDGAEDLETYSAVRLFTERARQVHPGFTLADHRAAVTSICQLVEGIPLAIELAANWMRTLTCEAIAAEIQTDIDFLTSREHNIPERHRSMRAVYNHSWRLLFETERGIFQKLSVFQGGFTREAAEQVAGASLASLAALTDKSLVWQDSSGRYHLHELLRQYGAEQLAETGEVGTIYDRHAAYFADFAARCWPEMKGPQQLTALDKIEADFENIRAAWSHAMAQRAYQQIDTMIRGLYLFGHLRGRFVETWALFEAARTAFAPVPGETSHPVWGRVLARAPRKDMSSIEQALEIARQHQDDVEIAFCLRERGREHAHRGSFAQALSDLQTSLDICRRLDDRFGAASTLVSLMYSNMTFGDWEAGKDDIDQGLRLAGEIGSPYHRYMFTFYRGWAACYDGHYDAAEHELQQAFAIASQMRFPQMIGDSAGSLGYVAFLRGDMPQARARITEDLETVTRIKAYGEQGFAKIVLAHIACIEERYPEARQIAEEALALVKPQAARERFVTRALALAACGLGEYDAARAHLGELLVQETRPGVRVWFMPICALLAAHEGRPERAAELLGLACTHPASATGWLERWPLLTRLRAQLAAQLGEAAYAAAWERGSQLDLDTVVQQLLVETDAQAQQPLAEALTERELEVLRLVAEGRSNRDIAAALTITAGTVRTHVFNLCQKLDARSRTQAVARARVLRILS